MDRVAWQTELSQHAPETGPPPPPPSRRYVLIRLIGEGGAGSVFLARDQALERDVALKLLKPGVDAGTFTREMQIGAALDHPHLPKVYDTGVLDGYAFFAMTWVEGEDLAALLARGEGREVVAALAQACRALDALHRAGWVHGDPSPRNIRVRDADRRAFLLDLGLASRRGEPWRGGGTPGFRAPGRADPGALADSAADLWAVGAILGAVATGTPELGSLVAVAQAGAVHAAALADNLDAWLAGRVVLLHRYPWWVRAYRTVLPFAPAALAVIALGGAGSVAWGWRSASLTAEAQAQEDRAASLIADGGDPEVAAAAAGRAEALAPTPARRGLVVAARSRVSAPPATALPSAPAENPLLDRFVAGGRAWVRREETLVGTDGAGGEVRVDAVDAALPVDADHFVAMVERTDRVVLFDARAPVDPVWAVPTPSPGVGGALAVGAGRVVLAQAGAVVAHDAAGARAWSQNLDAIGASVVRGTVAGDLFVVGGGVGAVMALGAADGAIRWQIPPGQGVAENPCGAERIQPGPDGARVLAHEAAAPFGSPCVAVVSGADGRVERVLPHPAPVVRARWSPDGRWIVTGDRDGTVRWWDADASRMSPIARRLPRPVDDLVVDGEAVWVVDVDEDWHILPPAPSEGRFEWIGPAGDATAGWSGDGAAVWLGVRWRGLFRWSTRADAVQSWHIPSGDLAAVLVAGEEAMAATFSGGPPLGVDGRPVSGIASLNAYDVAIGPDGRSWVAGGNLRRVTRVDRGLAGWETRWDVAIPPRAAGPRESVMGVGWAGDTLVAVGIGCDVHRLAPASGAVVASTPGLPDCIAGAGDLTPDGRWFIHGDRTSRDVLARALDDGRVVRRWALGAWIGDWPVAVDVRGSDGLVAVGAWDGRLVILDLAASEPLAVWDAHPSMIQDVAFQPGGDLLVSTSRDGVTRLWDLSPLR